MAAVLPDRVAAEAREAHQFENDSPGAVLEAEAMTETHRRNFGWFGDPWPSGICYDQGHLLEEHRKTPPVGEDCVLCDEPIAASQSGKAMPHLGADGATVIRHAHKECLLRSVIGPPEHLDGLCGCRGGGPAATARTFRQEALAVWERIKPSRRYSALEAEAGAP